jgi:hypothetical protein
MESDVHVRVAMPNNAIGDGFGASFRTNFSFKECDRVEESDFALSEAAELYLESGLVR